MMMTRKIKCPECGRELTPEQLIEGGCFLLICKECWLEFKNRKKEAEINE
jgi:DNA-directed RNA polymerase subunit RPC12/RpoP